MKRPIRFLVSSISLTVALLFAGAALAQVRQFKVCVPDYSVGVMPFFVAKQNGYLAQEQIDIDVIAGRGNLCTWD
jgi:ABC-type nitrate/sulfonate/bicarbonate transport system substrate-binding protein